MAAILLLIKLLLRFTCYSAGQFGRWVYQRRGIRGRVAEVGGVVEENGGSKSSLVGPLMLPQVVLPSEPFVAPLAREGPNSTVDSSVSSQLLVSGEGLVTVVVLTNERSLS